MAASTSDENQAKLRRALDDLRRAETALQRGAAERTRAETALREHAIWLRGQGDALTAAVNDAPLEASLGALVGAVTTTLGEGVRAAFYLAAEHGMRHIVGMPDEYAYNYRGCWSFPIHSGAGTVVGTLALYWPEPRAAAERELELAALLTNTASIIISRHREQGIRRQTEAALRASEEKHRSLFTSIDEGFCTIEVLFDERGHACDYRFLEVNPAFVRHTGIVGGIGRTVREVAPGHEDFWFDVYGRIATTGEPLRFEHEAAALGRFFDVYAFRIGAPGENRVAIIFNDITQRRAVERALRASEDRQRFLLALSDALRPLGDAKDIQRVAARLLGQHLRANQVHYAETVDDVVVIDQGYGNGLPPMVGRFRYQDFGEALVATYRAGRTAVCRDVTSDRTVSKAAVTAILGAGFKAYIAVPLLKDGAWVATLAVHSIEPRAWTPDEIVIVEQTAERTWAAVERARAEAALRQAHTQLERRVADRTADLAEANTSLEAQIRERRVAEAQIKGLFSRLIAVQELERSRIARDIHDQLGQQMTALRMNLELLASRAEHDDLLAEQAVRTQRLAGELDKSVDFLTWDLRPAALDHLGLAAALAKLASDWSERFNIAVEFDDGDTQSLRLPREVEANLYRLAQEALHNVLKHANATRVAISVQRRRGHLVLVIEDNGRGFDATATDSRESNGGLGLVSMRERGALIGGTVEIESAVGTGTTIFVTVPLTGADRDRS